MALKRVTMQEIADACGLSRNTVSKVFNGRGSVPESTKNLVIEKARELGYYRYSSEDLVGGRGEGNIALLAQHKFLSHFFGTHFFTSFTDQISQYGYTMQMYEVSAEDIAGKRLPPLFDPKQTAGILGIELFDRAYTDMICSLGIPTTFVDGFVRSSNSLIQCDFVSMENITSEGTIVSSMVAGGAKKLGFVGDINHCNSFFERWVGFRIALEEAGLSIDRKLCILEKDGDGYGETDWLLERLAAMPVLPDAFACANDYLAVHLMMALKSKGVAIPDDVMVAGFGNSPEARVIEPRLTTAQIPSGEIGRFAATVLAKRIQQSDFPFHWTYVKTTPIWGDSTR